MPSPSFFTTLSTYIENNCNTQTQKYQPLAISHPGNEVEGFVITSEEDEIPGLVICMGVDGFFSQCNILEENVSHEEAAALEHDFDSIFITFTSKSFLASEALSFLTSNGFEPPVSDRWPTFERLERGRPSRKLTDQEFAFTANILDALVDLSKKKPNPIVTEEKSAEAYSLYEKKTSHSEWALSKVTFPNFDTYFKPDITGLKDRISQIANKSLPDDQVWEIDMRYMNQDVKTEKNGRYFPLCLSIAEMLEGEVVGMDTLPPGTNRSRLAELLVSAIERRENKPATILLGSDILGPYLVDVCRDLGIDIRVSTKGLKWIPTMLQAAHKVKVEQMDSDTLTNVVDYLAINSKHGRNEPCPCGSEKKFKKCCSR